MSLLGGRILRRRAAPWWREVAWPLVGWAGAGVVLARRRRTLDIPRAASTAIAASVPLALARAMPAGNPRRVITWAAHMWAYKIAFEVPHDDRARQRRRLKTDYVIACDRLLAGGVPAPQRLQRALRRPPRLTPLDWIATAVYAAWEAEPHAALAWILWRHPDRFRRSALRLGATFDLTLIGYWAVPTAPPWWASEQLGRMDGEVHRVAVEALRELRGKRRPAADHEQGANPWGSMPSDHLASAAMTAMILADVSPRAGLLGAAYAVALGVTLVYLGEHYVTDLLAGLTLAGAVRWATS